MRYEHEIVEELRGLRADITAREATREESNRELKGEIDQLKTLLHERSRELEELRRVVRAQERQKAVPGDNQTHGGQAPNL